MYCFKLEVFVAIFRTFLVAFSTALVVACGGKTDADTKAVSNMPTELPQNIVFNKISGPNQVQSRNDNISISVVTPQSFVLTGSVENPSAAGIPGAAVIALCPKFAGTCEAESKISGQILKISGNITAMNADALKFVYSTANNGNSGWMEHQLSEPETAFEFLYNVPVAKNMIGDFMGFNLVGTGETPTATIENLTISISY